MSWDQTSGVELSCFDSLHLNGHVLPSRKLASDAWTNECFLSMHIFSLFAFITSRFTSTLGKKQSLGCNAALGSAHRRHHLCLISLTTVLLSCGQPTRCTPSDLRRLTCLIPSQIFKYSLRGVGVYQRSEIISLFRIPLWDRIPLWTPFCSCYI